MLPSIHVAIKTVRAIDDMVRKDQGASYRGLLGRVMPFMEDAYRTDEDGHRSHLGASILGQECGRAIYYNFHWVTKSNFEGRIVRLFNRGHIEEGRFIALLLMLGCDVMPQDENGKQFRISFAEGHGGGSGDGMAIGIPDVPEGTKALTEFKTHSEKSFIELAGPLDEWREYVAGKRSHFSGKGVRAAKFEHYVQMQIYMRKMGLACAVYFAVNKNTDDLYIELVMLDSETADRLISRGETIVYLDTPPEKINKSPGFFKCRFCDHRSVCHNLGASPDVNCRTCQFSYAAKDGTWRCGKFNDAVLSKELQLTGCSSYSKAKHFGT